MSTKQDIPAALASGRNDTNESTASATVACTPEQEYAAYFDAGIDGLFSDWTTTAVAARNARAAR